MIVLSNNFKSLYTKIYTFSFFSLLLEYSPINSIKVAEIEIDEGNRTLMSGIFCFVVGILLVASTFFIIRDYLHTKIDDHKELALDNDASSLDFSDDPSIVKTALEKYEIYYVFWSRLAFGTEAFAPLALGIFSIYACWGNVVLFIQHIVN